MGAVAGATASGPGAAVGTGAATVVSTGCGSMERRDAGAAAGALGTCPLSGSGAFRCIAVITAGATPKSLR